jgi:hypothetical protein
MDTFLTAATLMLGLVSLWAGFRHLKSAASFDEMLDAMVAAYDSPRQAAGAAG